jgi:hypothetical protein
MRGLLLAIAIFSQFLMAQDFANRKTRVAIEHVTVVDVLDGQEHKDQTVVIEEAHIASITPSAQFIEVVDSRVDGARKYLIPGLWDMHIHVRDPNELPLYIANGVTGVRIMSGERNDNAYRATLEQISPTPHIYLASIIVDGDPPVWPDSLVFTDRRDAAELVSSIKASGADFIKIYDRIPRDAYFALATEAKRSQIDFEGHLPWSISAQEASSSGQRSMEHLQGIAVSCSAQQGNLMEASQRGIFRDRFKIEEQAFRSFDDTKCSELFGEFRKADTWQVPTLTVRRVWGMLNDRHFTADPRTTYIDGSSLSRWKGRIRSQSRQWSHSDFELARHLFLREQLLVGQMYQVGVPLIAGTDAMNPYVFPGFSLHDELALLVQSGLSPLAALQSATINPARFIKRETQLGSIDVGKIADLVLLRADPLADIHNTTQIEQVWLAGTPYDQDQLSRLLSDARNHARHSH